MGPLDKGGLKMQEASLVDQSLQGWEDRVRRIDRCRICDNPFLETVIDLGAQSLSCLFDDGRPHNRLATPIPLEVVRCAPRSGESACGLVQLRHTVPPDIMFRDYGYRSGVNTTMRLHLQELVREIESRFSLKTGDLVVDIGANDGTTLLAYRVPGLVKVGFEPSDVRPEGGDQDLIYLPHFFSRENFQRAFPRRKVRVVTAIAMFYDIDAPTDFCRQVHDVLSDDGCWVVEVGYWGAVLENIGFDSICHEHLVYYGLSSLRVVMEKTGFDFLDVGFNASNGGSVRCTLIKKGSAVSVPQENRRRIDRAFREEEIRGGHSPERLGRFRERTQGIRRDLLRLLQDLRSQGKTVFGYGASTKGNVLLQYGGVGPHHLQAIADRNPAKWGRKTPATGIPICSEDEMRTQKPDFLLILPWHFLEEFLQREGMLRRQGTRFIVPFPTVRIV